MNTVDGAKEKGNSAVLSSICQLETASGSTCEKRNGQCFVFEYLLELRANVS